jgi:alanyl-tRNA synthetase
MILVRRCNKIRQDWRVEFVCGGRAERAARQDFLLLRHAAERLGCAPGDLVASAERVAAERDAHFKSARAALERLAQAEATLTLQGAPAGEDGIRLIARTFQEDAQAEYLNHFATQLAKSDKTIALLARFPCGHLIFAQHPSAGKDMNGLLKQVLQQFGGKGGGTRDFARGRLSDATKAEMAIALSRELAAKA